MVENTRLRYRTSKNGVQDVVEYATRIKISYCMKCAKILVFTDPYFPL